MRAKFKWILLVGTGKTSTVFIRGAPSDSSLVETVFSEPILPGSRLQEADWDELELSPRTLLSWQATFQSLLDYINGVEYDQATKADLFVETKEAIKFSFTPRKRANDKSPDALDTKSFRVKLAPVASELGERATPSFQRLAGDDGWPRLVKNVESCTTLSLIWEKAQVHGLRKLWTP